ncbi:MAG: hypothetical protein Q4F95_06565 [Oscillospiraceae bacterium]|nr:hypothetical protein [Oscillospiraceae bacterium]
MQTDSRTQNTIRNTMAALLLKLLTAVVSFVMQTVFIYTLGKQYTGISGLFSDILLMLSMTELGIGAAVLFALYKPVHDNDNVTAAKYLRLVQRAYLTIAAVITAAGLLLIPFLDLIVRDVPDIRENIRLIFMMFVFRSAATYLFSYKTILLEAYQKKRKISLISCAVTVTAVLTEVPLLIITHNYLLYLGIEIVSVFAKNLLISAAAKKTCPEVFSLKVSPLERDVRNKLWNDVSALAIYRVANVVLNSTDSIIISGVIGTQVVSLLVGYRLIINLVCDLTSQFFYSALPSVGNYIVSKTKEEAYHMYRRFQFVLFFLTSVSSVCLITLLNPFIEIWLGGDFCFPVHVTAVLVLNFYTTMMMQVNTTFRNGYGLYIEGRFCPLVMAVLNIVLSVWWANLWGIAGVLLATSVSRLLTQIWVDPVLLYRYAFKRSCKKYFAVYFFCFVITAAVCTASFWITGFFAHSFIMLFIRLAAVLMISCTALYLIFRKTEEFQYMISMLRRLTDRLFRKGVSL